MTEREVTKVALQVILRKLIGTQAAIWPTFEVGDIGGLRPDGVLVALDDELDIEAVEELCPDDLVVHTIESKIERQYLIGPEFSGAIQAGNYWGNFNWLASPKMPT
jgi:hypothetical protein